MNFETVFKDGYYQAKSGLNYTHLLYFEKSFFDEKYVDGRRQWMHDNWYLSIISAFIYVLAVFGGKAYMKNREKFDLRKSLIMWNLFLAVFSFAGSIRSWPEFIHTLSSKGVGHSVCSKDFSHGVAGCWAWLFILSKLPELIDTVFIVLRKQQLIFLHWYHHATVLVYCWYSTRDFSSTGRWFIVMNYTIHGFMYSYYCLRALRFKIPKWVNIAITSGQLSQMVFGIYVNVLAYIKKKNGEECGITEDNLFWSFMMYFSYFLLFFHFFYKAYISKKPIISKDFSKESKKTN